MKTELKKVAAFLTAAAAAAALSAGAAPASSATATLTVATAVRRASAVSTAKTELRANAELPTEAIALNRKPFSGCILVIR